MKKIKFMLFAVAMLLAASALLTSCQEDAPEINYTVSVSMSNDLSQIVEAINNGSLKNEEAIKKLTEAIDKMDTDQQAKLQAIIDMLDSMNGTLEAKLAAIEAAMKSQTLTLESKLGLLEAAINALPDYGDKFDAVVTALNAIQAQTEALGTSQEAIATQIATVTTSINNLIAEVNTGNTSAADAFTEIIAQLEALKEALNNMGSEHTEHTNTVILDGVSMPILSAVIDQSDLEEDNNYDIYLYLSENKKCYVEIMANGYLHYGKTIDLTQKEETHSGKWYWAVQVRNPEKIFDTYADPMSEYPVFQSGTLFITRIGGNDFEIVLQNGKVKSVGSYGDGEEHTISLDFKGKLEFDEV